MAINPIALYSDPVKYKEVLEKSSHLFDDMKPFFETAIEQNLKSLKDDFAQINAAIGPDYSLKDNGYLDIWYDYDPEYAIEIRDKNDKRIHQAEQSLSTIHWMFDVCYPTLGVYAAIQQMWAYEEEAPAIETPYQLTAEEVYDQLTKANELLADKLIRRISCPMYARKQLLDAYKTHDKDTFISILEDPANNCDCTEIYKYANTRSASRAEEVINSALYLKELNHYLYGELKALQDWKDEIQSAKDGVTLSLFVNRVADIFKYLNNIEISLHNRIQKLELANTYPSTESQINVYEMMTKKSLYYDVFNKYSKFNDIERGVLDSILKRPAGLELYNKYKAEYEKERIEAQAEELEPEEQNTLPQQMADSSEDTSKQGAQHKEPLTGTSGAGKDGTPYKKFIVPNNFKGQSLHWDKDEYFSAMNENFDHLGEKEWNKILDKLVSFRFLAEDKDKQLLFYRLTGLLRPEGELGLIKWNSENGHCKELLYFLKYILPGNASKKYDKVKGYFCELSKWPEERPSTYAQGANKYFKIAMHTAAPEVFPEYNKRERKPKKSTQKQKLDS